jgi:mRNA-degrading endonuclease RelE of RelBE toxin-antitoxin system
MRFIYTERFRKSYEEAPTPIKKTFEKQAAFLTDNLRHPSLKAKKYDEKRDIWQARVTGSWRFYFRIEGDAYTLLDIMPHPK